MLKELDQLYTDQLLESSSSIQNKLQSLEKTDLEKSKQYLFYN